MFPFFFVSFWRRSVIVPVALVRPKQATTTTSVWSVFPSLLFSSFLTFLLLFCFRFLVVPARKNRKSAQPVQAEADSTSLVRCALISDRPGFLALDELRTRKVGHPPARSVSLKEMRPRQER